MNDILSQAIEELEESGNSASLSVADHLSTVASNGPDYATPEAMHEEARALIAAARWFLQTTNGTEEEGETIQPHSF